MSKRAILYARVSTNKKADKDYSLQSQLEACRKYAMQNDFAVVGEFQDEYSGLKFNRPEFDKVRAMVERREADAVIVHASDRLSRLVVHSASLRGKWEHDGIELHFVRRGKAGGTPENKMMDDIESVFAEYWAAKIREATMRAKRSKALDGKIVCCGRAPYGYAFERDANGQVVKLVIDKETGRIVRRIYQWYVYGGEGKPLSAAAIAKRLSEMHVPAPGELQRGYHRKRESGMWQACKILEIIAHEVYAGVWRFGGRIGDTRKRRPLHEQVAVPVPPIVDRETWERAQTQRRRNKVFSFRNAKHQYLLRGLIKCACGYSRVGNFFSDHRYYTCASRHNHHSDIEPRKCFQQSVRADAMEFDAWQGLKGFFEHLEDFDDLLRQAQHEEENAIDPKREDLETVEKQLADCEKEVARTAKALVKATGAVGDALEREMRAVNERHLVLTKRRDELRSRITEHHLTDDAAREVQLFAHDVREGLENADYAMQRQYLELLGVTVTVNEGRFVGKCLLGEWQGEITKIVRNGKVGTVPDSRSPKLALL